MSELHEALKTLSPLDYSSAPLDKLSSFLTENFSKGQTIVESIPIPPPSSDYASTNSRSRSDSAASCSSEVSISSARSAEPSEEVKGLQKEWKNVKLNARDNPLGISVYKMNGKDGRGTWFARRSVHEGLGFSKWKGAMEREFPEGVKIEGGPGEGAVRGIGGEKRVAYQKVDGVGKMEVYLLSAQFPGPTTPRDFVTMFLTSDQVWTGKDVPRHFMVISRPCNHPNAEPRSGFIRGQYESVEFIREIPINKGAKKSASTTNLPDQGKGRNRSGSTLSREAIMRNASKHHQLEGNGEATASESNLSNEGRARGKTISFDKSRGDGAKGEEMDVPRDDDESEQNPVEWIMLTRSDPGGSVPRFMIDRGTPGGIVADAAKFLDWACAKDIEDLRGDDDDDLGEEEKAKQNGASTNGHHDDETKHEHKHHKHHSRELHNPQTNGHLAGIEEKSTPTEETPQANSSSLYGTIAGAAGVAGGYIASHTPAMISDYLPSYNSTPQNGDSPPRRTSISSIASSSSATGSEASFASALETSQTNSSSKIENGDGDPTTIVTNDGITIHPTDSSTLLSLNQKRDKELLKLEEKKRKISEKLQKARQKEENKKIEDEEAIRKAKEKHDREVKKQEEKYRKEMEKLEQKRIREENKVADRKRKELERDEKARVEGVLEEIRAELECMRREREVLKGQVGELQAENTRLVAVIGGVEGGEGLLRGVREGVGRGGRERAVSLRGVERREGGSGSASRASISVSQGSGSGGEGVLGFEGERRKVEFGTS